MLVLRHWLETGTIRWFQFLALDLDKIIKFGRSFWGAVFFLTEIWSPAAYCVLFMEIAVG